MFDLSHNNQLQAGTYAGDIGLFAQAKAAGWPAMMHKLTQGAAFVDPCAVGRLKAAISAELMIGGYHYMTADPLAAQVALFMHSVGQMRSLAPHFAMALDFEVNASLTPMADQFCAAVYAATGAWPLLYTGRWDVSPDVSGTCLPACPLWLAEYGSTPIPPGGWINWMFHQYSDGKAGPSPISIPGVGLVDQSRYAGSIDELTTWWQQ